jgi:hypothetical protein
MSARTSLRAVGAGNQLGALTLDRIEDGLAAVDDAGALLEVRAGWREA